MDKGIIAFALIVMMGIAYPLACGTLTGSNTMTGNLTINGSTCFTFGAANTTLDCNGYSVTGNNTTGTNGIYTNGYSNITVKNCYVRDFQDNIALWSADNSTVQNTTSNGAAVRYALQINSGNNDTILNSTLYGNRSALVVQGTTSKIYATNTSIASGWNSAISIAGTTTDVLHLSNSPITSATGDGATIAAAHSGIDCGGGALTGTNATNSHGIYSDQPYTTIKNCFSSWFDMGIAIYNANSIVDNVSGITNTTNLGYGIYLNGNNQTISNAAGTGQTAGITFAQVTGGTMANVTGTSLTYAFYLGSGSGINVTNASVTGSNNANSGFALLNSDNININCQGGTIAGLGTSYYGVYQNGQNLTVKNCNFNNWLYGIYAANDNLVLDCQGGYLNGSNKTGSYGIYNTKTGYAVKNCNITNFATGVYLTASNGAVSNVSAYTTHAASGYDGFGILDYGGTSASVSSSYGYSLTSHGVYIYGDNSNLTNVKGETGSASGYGFYALSSNALNFTNVSVPITNKGYGIYIQGVTNSVFDCSGNTMYSNPGVLANIYTTATSNHDTIQNCKASNASYPFYMQGNNLLVKNNTITLTGDSVYSLYFSAAAYNNTACWNNLTATTGIALVDNNGTNFYNGSACNGEGNVWANVMSGAVNVRGLYSSVGYPSLYVGTYGAVPYNNLTSMNFVCSFAGCGDYAPLTQNQTFIGTLAVTCPNGICTQNTTTNETPFTANITATGNFLIWSALGNCTILSASNANTTVTIISGNCTVLGNFGIILGGGSPGGGYYVILPNGSTSNKVSDIGTGGSVLDWFGGSTWGASNALIALCLFILLAMVSRRMQK